MDGFEEERAGSLLSSKRAFADVDDGPVGGGKGEGSRGVSFAMPSTSSSAHVGEKRGRAEQRRYDDDEDDDDEPRHFGGKGGKSRRTDDDEEEGRERSRDRSRSGSQGPPKEKRRKTGAGDGEGTRGTREEKPELDISRYLREGESGGKSGGFAGVKDKKLKSKLQRAEGQFREAARDAKRAELLLTEEAGFLEADDPMERSWRFPQSSIAAAADAQVGRKAVSLSLPSYGPYSLCFSRNGRAMLLAGSKGHVACLDWQRARVSSELHTGQQVRAACLLHDSSSEGLFAVAQKKAVYIYDSKGTEVHKLQTFVDPVGLAFLPFHFLLSCMGNGGWMKWQDISTGKLVAETNTHCQGTNREAFRLSEWNGIMGLGQGNGTVSLWSPNLSTPLVRIAAHPGAPVSAIAFDCEGRYLVTAGAGSDSRVKVWDCRRFSSDSPLASYFTPTPVTSLDISQRGLVAVGFGGQVQVWGKDYFGGAAPASNDLLSSSSSSRSSSSSSSGGLAKLVKENQRERKKAEAAAAAAKASAGASASAGAGGGGVGGAGGKAGGHIRFSEDDDDDDDADAAAADDDDDDDGGEPVPAPGNFLPGKRPPPSAGGSRAKAPYLKGSFPGTQVASVRFQPYDDFLAVGHSKGVSTMIVPGAGEPSYDSHEADPFATRKQRKEMEVRALLDKLNPATITLDPSAIGTVDTARPEVREKERKDALAAAEAAGTLSRSQKKRLKKKSKTNVITEQRQKLAEKMRAKHEEIKEKAEKEKRRKEGGGGDDDDDGDHGYGGGGGGSGSGAGASAAPSSALSRFYGKKK